MRRVVITGIGPIWAGGVGKDDFWQGLLNKKMVIEPVPKAYEKTYCFKSRFFVPKPVLPSDGLNRKMEETSKLAVASARLAVADAEIQDLSDAGVVLGMGMNSLKTGLESYAAHNGNSDHYFNRMSIPMLMTNSAAAWISIDQKSHGMSYTINAACASGSIAVGETFLAIKGGRMDVALTGGVECLDDGTGSIMRGFDSLATLTTAADGVPMPFSKKRSGFLFNMGAGCILILEELEHAKRRNAKIYAEICDYAINSEGHNIVQMHPKGESIQRLFDAVKEKKIDYINAHGTATLQNDEIEARMLKKIFKDKQPYINSTKGILGHSIGASGALEAAVCALSIENNMIHGNQTEDEIEGLNLPIEATNVSIECAVSVSYGFGGHHSLLLFRRYEDE